VAGGRPDVAVLHSNGTHHHVGRPFLFVIAFPSLAVGYPRAAADGTNLKGRNMNGNFRAAVALSLSIILSSVIASWAFLHAKKLSQTIQVTGSAKKRIKSDLMIWNASVTVESASLADAYGKLSRDVEKTKAFLIHQGVPENQIVISAVSTTPVRRGKNSLSEGANVGAISGPVTGYSLKQSLGIRSSDIDKITNISRQVTELINQAILLESEEPQYLYTRIAETKVEILAAAARDAKERAQQIAASTGSRVGGIRSAEMGVLQITAADSSAVSGYGENDTKSLEKDITAVVHVTFAIE
jgi:uncharacterized protein